MTDTYKPSWVPEEENDKFACRVMYGVTGGHEGTPGVTVDKKDKVTPAIKRRKLEVDDYVEGVLKCDRAILSRAITLVESNAAAHFETAQQVIQKLLPYTGKSTRVGITGVPGAGKSTFIEALGTNLCRGGHKVAVLAVDPSSTVTKGSILGDKTRMEQLSREPNAFIRPPIPQRVSCQTDAFYLICDGMQSKLRIHLFEGTLKFFFDHPEDYYYLPAEDMAIHKSVATYVDKDFRKKATADNCYTKKDAIFVPQYETLITPFFKESSKDKLTYFELTREFLDSDSLLRQYTSHVFRHFLAAKH